jgi:hypothetical protein
MTHDAGNLAGRQDVSFGPSMERGTTRDHLHLRPEKLEWRNSTLLLACICHRPVVTGRTLVWPWSGVVRHVKPVIRKKG